jgi:hypothetical protein
MISSLEVGAILRVIDEASVPIKRISESFERLDAIVKRFKESLATIRISPQTSASLKGLNDQFVAIGGAADKGAEGAGAAFAGLDRSILATQERVAALKREMATVGGIGTVGGSRTIGPGGQVLPHGAPGGGRGGLHLGRTGVGAEGFTKPHMSLPSTPVMAGIAAAGYGAFLEADMEDAIFKLEYHTGEKPTPENNSKFRNILQNAMAKTGYSLKEVSDAAQQEARMFKGTPGGGIDVLPEMLQAAATESRVKGTSLDESMTALTGLAQCVETI